MSAVTKKCLLSNSKGAEHCGARKYLRRRGANMGSATAPYCVVPFWSALVLRSQNNEWSLNGVELFEAFM